MKRMVLIALTAFCGLLLTTEEKASAIPCTFTWNVSGSMTGWNLGTSDASSWDAQFVIESTDLSWSDSWGTSGMVQNTSGDIANNIDFFNAVTYDLDGGKTYNVSWRLYASAHVEDSQGRFDWEIDGRMDRTGSFLWMARQSAVFGNAWDDLGAYMYAQSDPVSAAGSLSYGTMAVASSAAMDALHAKGCVSLNPHVGLAEGSSNAVFSGTCEVVPDAMPAPGGLMLGAFGIVIVGWLRGRRTL